ncbi:MAG TPA: monovalent cation/H+ antiporter complex subunit F [Verrucomicrobiota bacterium]|nr:monovalent cation/H+ antiporter complex subunit F [Verrucomicrobiota bacterium]
MMTYALIIAELTMTVSILLGLYRLMRGPHVIDRVMAFDLITTCAVGLIVLLSIQWGTAMYLELILIVSLLGFLTTVAFVFYLNKPGTDEPAKSEIRKTKSEPRQP